MLEKIKLSDFFSIFTDFNGLELTSLLTHSLDVAKLSVCLASYISELKINKSHLFTCGLFHDLGLFVQKLTNNIINDNLIETNLHDKSVYSFDMLNIIEKEDKKMLHPWISSNVLQYLDLGIEDDYIKAVRFGHSSKEKINSLEKNIRLITEILICADELSVIYRNNINKGAENAFRKMNEYIGTTSFSKEIIDSSKEFLMDLYATDKVFDGKINLKDFYGEQIYLNLQQTINISKLVSFFIDHRSPFTRNHTTYVAELSKILAEEILTEQDGRIMFLAGMLHDIGKLKTPLYILHKKGKLNYHEFFVMKNHIIKTYEYFEKNPDLHFIGKISYSHHERLDGSGYPFKKDKKSLDIHQRIISVADVYSALIEERPYREALNSNEALKIIKKEVNEGKLDSYVYEKLKKIVDNKFAIKHESNMLKYFFNIKV